MSQPERGLASIWDKHSKDTESLQLIFYDEGTHAAHTVLLPASVELLELKVQVRKDREFKPDSECEEGHHLKLYYPREGVDLDQTEDDEPQGGVKQRRTKKLSQHTVELKDEARWLDSKLHWKNGYSHRRDHSLVRHTTEVCEAIGQRHRALAEATFQAAKRLCCIVGVPLNVSRTHLLKKSYLVFGAVLDLLRYEDGSVEGNDGWGARKVPNNCEPLVVACGAHLHWHLAVNSEPYFRFQVGAGGGLPGKRVADRLEEVGVPPEYEPFQRLLNIGQAKAATLKQMHAAGLDPLVLGLIPKTQRFGTIAGGVGVESDQTDDSSALHHDSPTTVPLLCALRKSVGAIRHRQLTRAARTAAAKAALASTLTLPIGAAAAASLGRASYEEEVGTGGGGVPFPDQQQHSAVFGVLKAADAGVGATHATAAASATASVTDTRQVGLENLDGVSHGEWEQCDDEALDVCAHLCLGALWHNLQAGPTSSSQQAVLSKHGAEALAYAVLLAVHGGVSGHDGGDDDNEPKSPKSPKPNAAAAATSATGRPPVLVRGLAAHLVVFLLVREPRLRTLVAQQSSSLGAHAGLDDQQYRKGQAALTCVVPGLASLMWSSDSDVALCGAVSLACCVASPRDRKLVSRRAAELSVGAAGAFAVKALQVDRTSPKGNLMGDQGPTLVALALRGLEGDSAVSALDHALVAVWGLMHVLVNHPRQTGGGGDPWAAFPPSSPTPHAHAPHPKHHPEEDGNDDDSFHTATAAGAGGLEDSPPSSGVAEGAVEPPDSSLADVIASSSSPRANDTYPLFLPPRNAKSDLFYATAAKGAATQTHGASRHTTRKFGPKRQLSKAARLSARAGDGDGGGGALSRKHSSPARMAMRQRVLRTRSGYSRSQTDSEDQDEGAEGGAEAGVDAAAEAKEVTVGKLRHGASSPAIVMSQKKKPPPASVAPPDKKAFARLASKANPNLLSKVPGLAARLGVAVGGGGAEAAKAAAGVFDLKSSGLLDVALLLCTWNHPRAFDDLYDDDMEPPSATWVAEEGEEDEEGDEDEDIRAGSARVEASTGVDGSGRHKGRRNAVAAASPPLRGSRGFGKGSGGGGYGVLSEPEVRCSVGILGLCASIDPCGVVCRLGAAGLSRLLVLCEGSHRRPHSGDEEDEDEDGDGDGDDDDEGGGGGGGGGGAFSERVQATAINALSFCAAAAMADVHDDDRANEAAAAAAAAAGAGGVAVARSGSLHSSPSKQSYQEEEEALRLKQVLRAQEAAKAKQVLWQFMDECDAVERIAGVRVKSRNLAVQAQQQSTFGATTQDARRAFGVKAKRLWGTVKACSVASMNLTALASAPPPPDNVDAAPAPSPAAAPAAAAAAAAASTETRDDDAQGGGAIVAEAAVSSSSSSQRQGSGGGGGGVDPLRMFGRVVAQVKAKLLFQHKRLLVIAQALFSPNATVVTEACASFWLLARDAATRRAIAALCVEVSRAKRAKVEGLRIAAAANKSSNNSSGSNSYSTSGTSNSASNLSINSIREDPLNDISEEPESESEAAAAAAVRAPSLEPKHDTNKTVTSQAHELPGDLLPRLIECVTGSEHDPLRAWGLAALSALVCDASFRQHAHGFKCAPNFGAAVSPVVAAAMAGMGAGSPRQKPKAPQAAAPPSLLVSALCEVLHAYAESGDPIAERRRLKRAQKKQAAAAAALHGAKGVGDGLGSGGGAGGFGDDDDDDDTEPVASPSFVRANAPKVRLAALSVSALLTLAYFHEPSLDLLRQPLPDTASKQSGGSSSGKANLLAIEAPLYRLLRRKDMCRRVKRSAAQLLLLLCANDVDHILSGEEPATAKTATTANFSSPKSSRPSSPAQAGGGGGKSPTAASALSAAATAAAAGASPKAAAPRVTMTTPLYRLSQAAHGPLEARADGCVLEEIFLRLLYEQMGPPAAAASDHHHAQEGVGFGGHQHNKQEVWGAATTMFATTRPTTTEAKEQQRQQRRHPLSSLSLFQASDPALPQAQVFGYSPHVEGGPTSSNSRFDGDEYNAERETLLQLCVHALTDLAARRDKAKALIVTAGGAAMMSRLLRAPPNSGNKKPLSSAPSTEPTPPPSASSLGLFGAQSPAASSFLATASAAAIAANSSATACAASSMLDQVDSGLGGEWRRTKPLHLLLNCSSLQNERVRSLLCDVCLDDLLTATLASGHNHNDGSGGGNQTALECQLAYGVLANLSKSTSCRTLIYRRSLDSGLLPPGAHLSQGAKEQQQSAAAEGARSSSSTPASPSSSSSSSSSSSLASCVEVEVSSRHPLFSAIKAQSKERRGVIEAVPLASASTGALAFTTGTTEARPDTTNKSQKGVGTAHNDVFDTPSSSSRPHTAPTFPSSSAPNGVSGRNKKNLSPSSSLLLSADDPAMAGEVGGMEGNSNRGPSSSLQSPWSLTPGKATTFVEFNPKSASNNPADRRASDDDGFKDQQQQQQQQQLKSRKDKKAQPSLVPHPASGLFQSAAGSAGGSKGVTVLLSSYGFTTGKFATPFDLAAPPSSLSGSEGGETQKLLTRRAKTRRRGSRDNDGDDGEDDDDNSDDDGEAGELATVAEMENVASFALTVGTPKLGSTAAANNTLVRSTKSPLRLDPHSLVPEHVASVASWMFNSHLCAPPAGAPSLARGVRTNPPLTLPDPATPLGRASLAAVEEAAMAKSPAGVRRQRRANHARREASLTSQALFAEAEGLVAVVEAEKLKYGFASAEAQASATEALDKAQTAKAEASRLAHLPSPTEVLLRTINSTAAAVKQQEQEQERQQQRQEQRKQQPHKRASYAVAEPSQDHPFHLPVGASTTRTRAGDAHASSLLPENVRYPHGANSWHPDIADGTVATGPNGNLGLGSLARGGAGRGKGSLAAAASAALLKDGKITNAELAAGSALISAFGSSQTRLQRRKSEEEGGGGFAEGGDGAEEAEKNREMIKHKLEVLKKVSATPKGRRHSQKESQKSAAAAADTGVTTVGGSLLFTSGGNTVGGKLQKPGTLSLTLNPSVSRGNHYTFNNNNDPNAPSPAPPANSKEDSAKMKRLSSAAGHQKVTLAALPAAASSSSLPTTANPASAEALTVESRRSVQKALLQVQSKQQQQQQQLRHDSSGLGSASPSSSFSSSSTRVVEYSALNKGGQSSSQGLHPAATPAQERKREKLLREGPGGQGSAVEEGAVNNATNSSSSRPRTANGGHGGMKKGGGGGVGVWMWPHVKGSVVSQQAGLVPYEVPSFNPASRGEGKKNKIKNERNRVANAKGEYTRPTMSIASALAAAVAKNAKKKGVRSSLAVGFHATSAFGEAAAAKGTPDTLTSPFFFFVKTSPAQPFPPLPLPPPKPPTLWCDVFQRGLPSTADMDNNTTPTNGTVGPDDGLRIGGLAAVPGAGPLAVWAQPPAMPGRCDSMPTMPAVTNAAPASTLAVPTDAPLDSAASPTAAPASPSSAVVAVPEPPGAADSLVKINVDDGAGDGDDALLFNRLLSPGGALVLQGRFLPNYVNKQIAHAAANGRDLYWSEEAHAVVPRVRRTARPFYVPTVYAPLTDVVVGDRLVRGGMPLMHPCLIVRAPVPKPPPVFIEPEVAKEGPPWDYLKASIFVPRKKTTDAKSMTDGPFQEKGGKNAKRKWRGFQEDWAKCMLKQERFTNLIKKGLKDDTHPEVVEVKDVLRRKYDWLVYVFITHAANDTTATDASYMGWLSYGALMELAGITDNESKACKQADLDTVFKAANYEVRGTDPDDDNPLEALTRQEWLEILIRLAKAKYGAESGPTLGPALEKLMALLEENLRENAAMNEEEFRATDLRHEWRLKEFYQEKTDIVYRRFQIKLKELYDSKIDYKDVGTHNLWPLYNWIDVMEKSKFFEDDSFTREEGNLCFYYSMFEVVDYQKDADQHECMDWLSFLEAFGHIARFKELPRRAELKALGLDSCCDLVDKIELENQTWNNYMARNPPQAEEDPFHVRLEEILKLLFHMLGKANNPKKGSALGADGVAEPAS